MDAAVGRSWLGDLAGRVTDAVPWATKPADTLNVALTADGLRALDVPTAVLDSFPLDFREGMGTAERARNCQSGARDGSSLQRSHVL